jgi:DNA-directed RNA polymerase subunit RPC12/RpoP
MRCKACRRDVTPCPLGTYDDEHQYAWLRCPQCRHVWLTETASLPESLRRTALNAEIARLAEQGLI